MGCGEFSPRLFYCPSDRLMTTLAQKIDAMLADPAGLPDARALISKVGYARDFYAGLGDRRAILALREGNLRTALAEAWATARRFPRRAENHALLAHILLKRGATELALEALRRAVELEPGNFQYQVLFVEHLSALAPTAADDAIRSAARFVATEQAPSFAALAEKCDVAEIGSCRGTDDSISSWVACPDRKIVTLELVWLTDDLWRSEQFDVQAGDNGVGSLEIRWPDGAELCVFKFAESGQLLAGSPVFKNTIKQPHKIVAAGTSDQPEVEIIIPVYKGYSETLNCLRSVLNSACKTEFSVTIVADNIPDSRLDAAIEEFAVYPRVYLLRNEENIGFTASVNRRLSRLQGSDVVLLNADTVVADGWLDRLKVAAYSSSDIGTVTPLSNNGEITSFPRPSKYNPMPVGNLLAEIDRTAAEVNSGGPIDLPTGVGFCLFIRKDCLQAVGALDAESFGHGYGEETDFCMRAVKVGWRSVCAPNVFVAHRSAISFGDEKHDLVQENMPKISQRHPEYRPLMRYYTIEKPLAASMRNLQRELLKSLAPGNSSLAFGPFDWRTNAHLSDFRFECSSRGENCLWMSMDLIRENRVNLESDAPGGPGALYYDLPVELDLLLEDLALLAPDRLHWHVIPDDDQLISTLLQFGIASRVYVTFSETLDWLTEHEMTGRRDQFLQSQQEIVVYSAYAKSALGKFAGARVSHVEQLSNPTWTGSSDSRGNGGILVHLGWSVKDYRLLMSVIREAANQNDGLHFYVEGQVPDEAGLCRTGRVTLLGHIDPKDRDAFFSALDCQVMLLMDTSADPTGPDVQMVSNAAPTVAVFSGGARWERLLDHPRLITLDASLQPVKILAQLTSLSER